MMEKDFIGSFVSIDCGESRGYYQGQIFSIHPIEQSVILQNAFHNGHPCKQDVTISAENICSIQVVNLASKDLKENPKKTTSNSQKPVHGRKALDFNNVGYSYNVNDLSDSPKKSHLNDFYSHIDFPCKTPNKKDFKRNRQLGKNELCFGTSVEAFKGEEFDFEKNLALFDKQAVFQEINSKQPDLVRGAMNRRKGGNLRYDENVLETNPVEYKRISVPETTGHQYVTDNGWIIPCITLDTRKALFKKAQKLGFDHSRQLQMIGRAASEMVFQLVGGSYRLSPSNTHQNPHIAIICGNHFQGAMGVNTACQLASHGINTTVYLIPTTDSLDPCVATELALYRQTGEKLTATLTGLSSVVDMIVYALEGHEALFEPFKLEKADWIQLAVQFCIQARAPILSLDPPAGSHVSSKWSLVPVLPLPLADNAGKVYLCDLTFPKQVYSEVGIQYTCPFGAKFFMPIHTCND